MVRSASFDYSRDFKSINFRKNPAFYQVGRGEQGVLLVEPYKSEILPYWRFKTPEIARKSAEKIYRLFLAYKRNGDFVGMDMARKFLQMGYTRARRYANHASGKKYGPNKKVLPRSKERQTGDKAKSARIFYSKYLSARNDPDYVLLKKKHQSLYG